MNSKARRRCAAKWFLCAASMACALMLAVFLINEPPRSVPEFLLNASVIFAAPVIITGAWGASLGAKILDPAATRSAGRAALIGLAVSVASFVSYVLILSLCFATLGLNPRGGVLTVFISLLIYGSILVGWLVGVVGALAGALLYKKLASERVSAGDDMPL
jgi:uncharacterized membrane protein